MHLPSESVALLAGEIRVNNVGMIDLTLQLEWKKYLGYHSIYEAGLEHFLQASRIVYQELSLFLISDAAV